MWTHSYTVDIAANYLSFVRVFTLLQVKSFALIKTHTYFFGFQLAVSTAVLVNNISGNFALFLFPSYLPINHIDKQLKLATLPPSGGKS